MHTWSIYLFPVIAVLMIGCLVLAKRQNDEVFLRCVFLGTVGGLLGTFGYDVFRIPFYYLGLNLLSPIRAYGMWLCNSDSSTFWTDGIGFAYHISNGITFGWIYAIIAHKRSLWWAILWGLLLETLAIFSSFGAVFGLQGYSNAILLAYIAHLFYGYPLGMICEDKPISKEAGAVTKIIKQRPIPVAVALTFLVGFWFIAVRPAGWQTFPKNKIVVGPDRLDPTWSNLHQNSNLFVENRTGARITVGLRRPKPDGRIIKTYEIEAGGELETQLDHAGIYQLQSMDHPNWRSIFLSVSHDDDYRTKSEYD